MDRDSLERIRNLTKDKITVSNFQKEQNMSNKNKRISMKKLSAVACICLVLTSGIVFAKDIEKFVRERFNFGLGDGVDSAAENGYIAEPEMENIVTETEAVVLENEIETVELDINTGVKINNFLMDDYNLSAEIELNFDEEIKKYVDFDNIKNIEFSDLIVLDEEKRIIFAAPFMTNDKFEELCNKYKLSYKRGEFNENYMNNGLNSLGKYIKKESNTIQWIYNMYAERYPKSKELNFYFTEITIYNEGHYPLETEGKKCVLKGEWEIHLDVPEKMYNRTNIVYKQKSSTNEDFNKYFSNDFDLYLGMHFGVPNVYGTVLLDQQISKLGRSTALLLACGRQMTLYKTIYFDLELFSKISFNFSDDKSDQKICLVPSIRGSFSYKILNFSKITVAVLQFLRKIVY